MNKKIKYLLLFVVILSILYFVISFILVNVFENKVKQISFNETNYENFRKDKVDKVTKIKIDNKDFTYHYFDNNSNKTVILTHGITVNKSFVSPIAQKLYQNGYNVVLYDLRRHGENKNIGTIPSFGVFESQDLHSLVLNLKKQHPNQSLNLYGVSMGAASVIKFAQRYDRENLVNSYVAESSFDSMFNQLNEESKSIIFFGISMFKWPMNWIINIKHHFNFDDANLLSQMQTIKHKMLLISPDHDPRINMKNSLNLLHKSNKDYVTFTVFEGKYHALSFTGKNKDKFFNILLDFYNSNN